jgi:hypothetical protein
MSDEDNCLQDLQMNTRLIGKQGAEGCMINVHRL